MTKTSPDHIDIIWKSLAPYYNNIAEGFGIFWGVFLGIIAGTAITLMVDWWSDYKKRNYLLSTLKFDLEYNKRKMDEYLSLLQEYHQSVIEGPSATGAFLGYFRFSDVLYAATNQLYINGFLAQHLSIDQVAKLHDAIQNFQPVGEQSINNQISNIKNNATNSPLAWESVTKPQALHEIRFWSGKFNRCKTIFQEIAQELNC